MKKNLNDYKWFQEAVEASFKAWSEEPEEVRQQYILDFLRKKAKEKDGDNKE